MCYIAGSGAAVTATGIFTAITQGILCAGAAVYGHQLIKQLGRNNGNDSNDDDEE